jgi:hypothetical protein
MKAITPTLAIFFLTLSLHAQTVYTVDNRSQSGAQYQVLQDAIDAASAGDIIQIHPSATNYGIAIVNKQLKLVGLGHNPATNTDGLTAKLSYLRFSGNSANSEVSGLTIVNAISITGTINHVENIHIIHNKIGSISISNSTGLLDSWLIEGNYLVHTSNCINSNASNWVIKNNFLNGAIINLNVTDLVSNNIFFSASNNASDNVFANCDQTMISNNIFITNGNMTEFAMPNCTSLNLNNNLTYSYVGNTIVALPGTANLNNTNPMFMSVTTGNEGDFYANDYHLNTSSSGANYGTDGTDIGLYGVGFLFDMFGRPDAMPYSTSMTISNTVVAPGQNLNVSFSAAQKQ